MSISYQLPVLNGESLAVHRMICIGRNYPDHVREMGGDPTRKPPIFFFKPLTALNTSGELRYPPFTQDLHHEVELVVAPGTSAKVLTARLPAQHYSLAPSTSFSISASYASPAMAKRYKAALLQT
jgi:hypothetical protein